MKTDGHQNDNAGSQSTNTTKQGASQKKFIAELDALHAFIFAAITVLNSCIQTKYPNGSVYETVYGSRLMTIFVIGITIYLFSLYLLTSSALHNNAELEYLMNKFCVFCGTLIMILEYLLLLKPFGWFILFVWSLCLLCFVCKYRQSLKTLCYKAVEILVQACGDVRLTLVDWNSRRRNAIEHQDNMSLSNGERAIDLPLHNLNTSNDRRATEHQSQAQNSTSVADHVLSIPDDSSYT